MTLAVNKMDGRGLSNTTHHECLPRSMVLATEGTSDSSNKMEHFCYKGEWANA